MSEIEKEFEKFITAMYGVKSISEHQEQDIKRAFYGGMLVAIDKMIDISNLPEDKAVRALNDYYSVLTKESSALFSL